MQVTLRKADTLQNELAFKAQELGPENIFEAEIDTIREHSQWPLDPTIEVSIHERRLEKVLQERKKEFNRLLEQRSQIYDAVYEIRDSVNKKNKEVGIDNLLNTLSRLQKDIELYNDLAKSPVRKSENELKKIAEKKQNKNDFLGKESIATGMFTRDEIKEFKGKMDELKRKKIKIKDQLLEKNVENKIELSSFAESVLRENSLID